MGGAESGLFAFYIALLAYELGILPNPRQAALFIIQPFKACISGKWNIFIKEWYLPDIVHCPKIRRY
jgi:hypothetical protein